MIVSHHFVLPARVEIPRNEGTPETDLRAAEPALLALTYLVVEALRFSPFWAEPVVPPALRTNKRWPSFGKLAPDFDELLELHSIRRVALLSGHLSNFHQPSPFWYM